MKKTKSWKHYYLTVKNGAFTRQYYTIARSEREARRDCRDWAEGLAFEGPIRLQRSKTIVEG